MRWALGLILLPFVCIGEPIELRAGVGIPAPVNARSPVRVDPIEAALIQNPLLTPEAGDKIGNAVWTNVLADANGQFSGQITRSGYIAFRIVCEQSEVRLLEASGHGMVYVNGAPRVGDIYQTGAVSLPVRLYRGVNRLVFSLGRGAFRARLLDLPKPLSFDTRDMTLPDARQGIRETLWAGVPLRNGRDRATRGLVVECRSDKGAVKRTNALSVLPLSVRKVPFEITLDGSEKYRLRLLEGETVLDEVSATVRVVKQGEAYKTTFRSGIDGSVQYYAVLPSTRDEPGQALFLSLHGASVEAIGQAQAYAPKSWGHIVAPTNRRPFGFDWEDIGRLDAFEVLEHAAETLDTDPTRTYLTGHSMGGHGTWQLGAHFPDRFAAIGPSAGWISFWTYANGAQFPEDDALAAMIRRAMQPSDTLALKANFRQLGVYVLHGDADDNVPVAQARTMVKELRAMGHDVQVHEQPGAGHWWENSDEPGAECVDWAPMFDLFGRRRIPLPEEVRSVQFVTASPGVSSRCHWLEIVQQRRAWEISSATIRVDPRLRRFTGTTQNIRRMTIGLDAVASGAPIRLVLDGNTLEVAQRPTGDRIHVVREHEGWRVANAVDPKEKYPQRYGNFKDVFRNRVIFVYGTQGTEEENAWAIAKATFDAEMFWVRGNGSVDVVPDVEFDPAATRGRNVMLYGHRGMNAAWTKVLESGEIDVMAGKWALGTAQRTGDAAIFAIRPRKGSETATVGIITGTTLVAMRQCDRVPIFTSGASMPDVLVFRPRSLTQGLAGMLAAGYFGNDWTVAGGEFAFQD